MPRNSNFPSVSLRFLSNQTEHCTSVTYIDEEEDRNGTSENFAIKKIKGEGLGNSNKKIKIKRGRYLDSARTRREEETPWFTGDEDEDEDQKKHKEKNTDNAL